MIDVQNQQDKRNIPIQKVGVKDVEIPLRIERKPEENKPDSVVVYAKVKMSVGLPSHFKGTHMSRFIEILNDYRSEALSIDDIERILFDMKNRLDATTAYLKFDFKYFIEKIAPKSKNKSLMCYDCAFEGELDKDCNFKIYLIVKVPLTTLCPCSKEISDYGAHNQRAIVKARISYDNENNIWLEDLIKTIEECASCEIYPLLKREDEKFVTEAAYNNPKFVEDIIRDVVIQMENNDVIRYYKIEVEAQESIHTHNAWAMQEHKK
ncbi:MAG: GTP cyclohydrolase I FolE2 [Candidatus Gastranaerophilales bacterium]|nr:GTP cyclohydrolase I FolE2 [Candidatus Gastranaerophilales bacterium]